jgi:arylsulfatase A-like enzyme
MERTGASKGERSVNHRNRLVAVSVLVLLSGLSSCSSSPSSKPGAPRRPNIVFVLVDDLDATVTPYWQAMPRTRKLIADRGTTFSNAFVTNPLCCPSRATNLTGMYPHDTKVFDSVTGLDNFAAGASKKTIGVRMRKAGYTTAFLGKYLNGYEFDPSYVPAGWDEWFGLAGAKFLSGYSYQANHNGTMERFGRKPSDYQTDVLARKAVAFVDRTEKNDSRPFLLTLFPSAPHDPIGPAPRDKSNEFADDPLPRRPNFNEDDVSDKPRWLRDYYAKLDPRQLAGQTKRYQNGLGSLIAVDDMVGSVEDRLRANGELDNTVFIFSSDNGFSFGSHRLPGKLVPYEESIRVPLAIAGPGVRHGTTDQLVANIDVAPTMYELAGARVPPDVDGQSLGPLLRGDQTPWRNDFLIEYHGTYSRLVQLHTLADVRSYFGVAKEPTVIPDYRATRSKRWLYVEWYRGPVHDYELYDLAADPYELSNLLAGKSAARFADTKKRLQARLEALASCSGRTCH